MWGPTAVVPIRAFSSIPDSFLSLICAGKPFLSVSQNFPEDPLEHHSLFSALELRCQLDPALVIKGLTEG